MSAPMSELRQKWAAAGNGGHQCIGCGEVFNSEGGHTAHRIGMGKARRCKTTAEIEAAGFTKNRLGRWSMAAQEGGAWWQKTRETDGGGTTLVGDAESGQKASLVG